MQPPRPASVLLLLLGAGYAAGCLAAWADDASSS